MISPILPAHEATTVALDFGVFIAEQARTHRVSQTAIIAALRPCITPSQPEASSKPHAPAADTPATQAAGDTTDGEAPPKPSSPAVDPDTSAVTAAEEQARHEPVDEWATPPERVDPVVANSLPGAECAEDRAQNPKRPRKETGRAKILATHALHPDLPSKLIAEHLSISEDAVRATASRKNIKLVSWWDYERALKAKTRQALAAAVEKPQEAVEPPEEPEAKTAPDLPPLSLPSERLPPPSVRPVRSAPSGRFYLRDKTTGHFVHQSLQPNPAGDGPMMTFDRKWAWYDTMERYRGAKKRWPQIEAMRKEAVSK